MSNSNFRPGNIIQGQPMPAVSATYSLIADNQFIQVADFTYVFLGSDSTTSSLRTFTIQNGQQVGQRLVLELISGGGTSCQLLNAGNVFLAGPWVPVQYQTLELIWDGGRWTQLGVDVSGPSGFDPVISSPADGDIIIYNSSSSEWSNHQVSSDATMTNTGALTVSKLHGATSAQILVADGSGKMEQVTMSGGATISNTGVVTVTGGSIPSGTTGQVLVNNGSDYVSSTMSGDASIVSGGAVSVTKLHGAASGQILVADGSGVMQQVTMSGGATISDTGVVTLGAGLVFASTTTTITDAELRALRTTAITLVPAPGAGIVIKVYGVDYYFNGIAGYTVPVGSIALNLRYVTGSTQIMAYLTTFLGVTAPALFTSVADIMDVDTSGTQNGFDIVSVGNSAIEIFHNSALNLSGGSASNTLVVKVIYSTVTIPLT